MRASVISRFAKNVGATQGRGRRLALAVPLAAVAAVGLVGCSNPQQHGTAAGRSATPVAQPSPSASASASAPVSAAAGAKLNGTGSNGLTISDGTQFVVMGGAVVDFLTPVHDLAWSPDGRKAAFIDGAGDLVVYDPQGKVTTLVAKHQAGQTWSHPTWQVAAADPRNSVPAKNNLLFVSAEGGTTRLERVSAAAVEGTPEQLPLAIYSEPGAAANPTTGNTWINAGGGQGSSVYANTADGQVYVRDDYLRQQGGPVTTGSQPVQSPDDNEIVFVRSAGGHDHLFALDRRSNKAKDLTPNATTDYTEPAFSPDGKTIAVRTPDGISTLPADGSAAPVHVSDYTGLPAYRHA